MVDKLTPTDSRVEHHTFTIPNTTRKYHYLLGNPSSTPVATVLLVHGFPDLAFGWRYQVPFLLARGLRVIVPDLVGYGQTDAPQELGAYSYKSVVDDLREVVRYVLKSVGEDEEGKIVLGGHDWGGAVVWRFALWYPEMLRCVFSVCTPYFPPSEVYIPKEVLVQKLPNFGYQLQFAGPDVEDKVVGRDEIRGFLGILYGGSDTTGSGEKLFDAMKGVRLDKIEAGEVGESPLLSKEEMDYYVGEYERNGMRGPLNWYRTGKVNYDEERKLIEEGRSKVTVPALMVVASRDPALPPAMAAAMDRYCEDLLVKTEVNATHWALWEAPAETNRHIGEFLDVILKDKPAVKASI